MADAVEPEPFEDLPKLFAAMAAASVGASRHLSSISIDRALAWPRPRDAPAVQRLTASFRLKLTRRRRRVVFWIARKEGLEEVLIDADVGAALLAVPADGPRDRPPDSPELRVLLPSLIWMDASPAERARSTSAIRFPGDPPPGPANSLLFRLATGGVLALYVPTSSNEIKDDDARLQYTDANGAGLVVYAEDADEEMGMPITVYLALLDALGDWTAQRSALQEFQVRPPQAVVGVPEDESGESDDTDGRSDVADTIAYVVAAHSSLRTELARASAMPKGGPPRPWLGHYSAFRIESFAARVGLKLNSAGQFAKRNDENPFQLEVTLDSVARVHGDQLMMRVRVPDLLADADGARDFIAVLLREDRMVDAVAADLELTLGAARVLLERAEVWVYRTRRREKRNHRLDTDICVFVARLGGTPVTVIYEAVFKIELDGSIELRVLPSRVLYVGRVADNDLLPDSIVEYFVRLGCAMLRWLNIFR